MTSADVIAALRLRYPPPAYAFLEEVANGTGGYNSNRADALVMSLWPSRGLFLYGFEVKVSKQDWKRELERPAKAEAIAKYCDSWFIAAPKGLILVADVPLAWGLIEVDDKARTRIVKEPLPPEELKPVSRVFLAAIFRKVNDTSEALQKDCVHKDKVAEASKDHVAAATRRLELDLEQVRGEWKKLDERVREFERASGIQITGWRSPKEYGEAVRIMAERRGLWVSFLEQSQSRFAQLSADTEQVLSAMKEAAGGSEESDATAV